MNSAPKMPQRALVIGEALIDIVERDGQVTGEHVGGSPLNVAVGLARLQHQVDFLTHIADDHRGRRIAEYVEDAGAQLVTGSVSADRTPTAVPSLDATGSASYTFDVDWQLDGTPEVPPPIVAHTGSIAAVSEPGCRATAALIGTYRPSATITFDPNVRPHCIDDADAARARIDRLIERSDVVKASGEDLGWIDPRREPEDIAQAWLDAGPSIVIVTLGAQGALATCAAGTIRVPATNVRVADTVGAGDAFMTGVIDALWSLGLLGAAHRPDLSAIRLDDLAGVLTKAVLLASLTITRVGADLPDRATRDAALESSILS